MLLTRVYSAENLKETLTAHVLDFGQSHFNHSPSAAITQHVQLPRKQTKSSFKQPFASDGLQSKSLYLIHHQQPQVLQPVGFYERVDEAVGLLDRSDVQGPLVSSLHRRKLALAASVLFHHEVQLQTKAR